VCGAASEITPQQGSTLSLVHPVEAWAKELHQWLSCSHENIHYEHSWRSTAIAYEQLYTKLTLNIPPK